MLDIVALALLLIAFAAIINYARKPSRSRQSSNNANPYHAVAIAKSSIACTASAKVVGRRYLSKEAPLLPLAGCTASLCNCRYVHYADRRSEDRRFPFGVRKSSEPDVRDVERRSIERRKVAAFTIA
jgi:hypothetical protein